MKSMPWKIIWSDALSMSNPEIDAEHQHFIALINELNAAILQRQERSEIARIMNRLVDDAVAHFTHEERLLKEKGYPCTQQHMQVHALLIASFRQAIKTCSTSNSVLRELINGWPLKAGWLEWMATGLTIKNQLLEHLLKEDSRYIDYLRTEK